jgi:flagellar hook-associated protein 2
VSLSADSVRGWTKPLRPDAIDPASGSLKLGTGEETFIPLSPPLTIGEATVLEMEVKVTLRPREMYTPPQPPQGPALPPVAPATLGDVSVQSSPSKVVLPEWKPPEPPKIVDDLVMGFVAAGGQPAPLPEFRESADFTTVKVPLSSYGPALTGIYFRNNNTYRDLEVRGIRVYDPTSRGDYRPLNPVSSAGDAEIVMNGVTIRRPSNTIDDLVPGVAITLRGAGTSPVDLRVEPDRERIKDSLIGFVGNYNKIIADINILTRKDENIITEISYLSDEEREKAREKLGIFQGDVTLMQMRNTFQGIMMNPYPTALGRDLSLLAQIGISTNTRQGGGGIDATKLRGYLEINESLLDDSLKKNLSAVRDLFGSDANGDLIPDTGAAVAMDAYIRPMVQIGGILPMKAGTIDSQIAGTNKRIESYNQYLERYEKDLKRKYGAMEGALGGLEKSSQTIENFNKSGSGNR